MPDGTKLTEINQACSNHQNTGLVWYSNGIFVSSSQMVWYSNGGLKTTEIGLYMVQNVWYLNGPPSYVTLPFEYRTPILFGIQMVTVYLLSLYLYCLS